MIETSFIKGYEETKGYFVDDSGQVYSSKSGTLKLLVGYPNTKGYLLVDLGRNRRAVKIHRLVAHAFIDNPDNLPQINHKDGDKTNNSVSNLEWITNADNMRHSFRNKTHDFTKYRGEGSPRWNKPHVNNKPVKQYTLDGEYITTHHSLAMAGRAVNRTYGNISNACRDWSKTSGGYRWKFAEK